jgi:L-ascorbate metabolism protein UlaG (beta-lactamase superfamily)
MKVFVIFGNIDFLQDDEYTALVLETKTAGFMHEEDIERMAEREGYDYIVPHHYNGRITFVQYHEETE